MASFRSEAEAFPAQSGMVEGHARDARGLKPRALDRGGGSFNEPVEKVIFSKSASSAGSKIRKYHLSLKVLRSSMPSPCFYRSVPTPIPIPCPLQANCGPYRCTLNRLCTTQYSSHWVFTFRFPRRVNRSSPNVEQIFPNTGSAVPSLLL